MNASIITSLMSGNISQEYILYMAAGLLAFLISLPVHESAHAYVASKLGDNTAKSLGRITLNPIKHFDLFGALSIIFVGVGWAKPVPINPYNFKNPKAGMAISSAAGPVSNLLLALIFMILYKILTAFYFISGGSEVIFFIIQILLYMVVINISLAIFNLIPVPPFDGSRIVNLFLPEHIYFKIMQYENILMIAVFVIVWSGALDAPLGFLNDVVYTFLDKITFFVDMIVSGIVSVS